jgi:hypothetical protein
MSVSVEQTCIRVCDELQHALSSIAVGDDAVVVQ